MRCFVEPFRVHTGLVVPLDRADIDTDQILPKQFLKRIESSGYGEFLFYDWSHTTEGESNPEFVLNLPWYAGSSILVTGRNFGCGSSREHAPWALRDWGFRVIIAPSFADIFAQNCTQNGVLALVLPQPEVDTLMRKAQQVLGYQASVDLVRMQVQDASGLCISFGIDGFTRRCLLEGLDTIGLTLQNESSIADYEARCREDVPGAAR